MSRCFAYSFDAQRDGPGRVGPVPAQAHSCRFSGDVQRSATSVEILQRLHRGCRFCQAGDDFNRPVAERHRPIGSMGRRGPWGHRRVSAEVVACSRCPRQRGTTARSTRSPSTWPTATRGTNVGCSLALPPGLDAVQHSRWPGRAEAGKGRRSGLTVRSRGAVRRRNAR